MSKHCPKLQDVNYLQKRIILQRSHHEHLEIRNNVKILANIRVWFQNDRCRVKFNDDAFFNQLYTHQTCWQPPLPVLKNIVYKTGELMNVTEKLLKFYFYWYI